MPKDKGGKMPMPVKDMPKKMPMQHPKDMPMKPKHK